MFGEPVRAANLAEARKEGCPSTRVTVTSRRAFNVPLLGSPFEKRRIVGSRKSDVLGAHDVDVRLSTNQPTDDVVVEVLVCGQSYHRAGSLDQIGEWFSRLEALRQVA